MFVVDVVVVVVYFFSRRPQVIPVSSGVSIPLMSFSAGERWCNSFLELVSLLDTVTLCMVARGSGKEKEKLGAHKQT